MHLSNRLYNSRWQARFGIVETADYTYETSLLNDCSLRVAPCKFSLGGFPGLSPVRQPAFWPQSGPQINWWTSCRHLRCCPRAAQGRASGVHTETTEHVVDHVVLTDDRPRGTLSATATFDSLCKLREEVRRSLLEESYRQLQPDQRLAFRSGCLQVPIGLLELPTKAATLSSEAKFGQNAPGRALLPCMRRCQLRS